METTLYHRVTALFEQLCDLPPAEQQAVLEASTVDEPALRRAVEAMLALDRQSSALLDSGLVDVLDEPDPERIAGFDLLERLGEGGMGRVFRAQQAYPRRQVALKLIHPHLLSERASRLFRFEAQAMAQVIHPGIPQIYEAGEDNGRLYIAMELIDGHPLTAAKSREETLRLLVKICSAVHHAHLRGIIHRDLKPDNILVVGQQPKVLDFGISSAINDATSEGTGTRAYMSPEQRSGAALDVRTDVFALGMIACELLTGARPFALSRRSPEEVYALVSAGLPATPTLPGDLRAVLCRALAAAPADRYPSAGALADDLQRFLAHEPVRAVPRTAGYRARKFIRRNPLLCGAVAAVFVALSAGGGVSWSMYLTAEEARQEEARQRQVAEAERERTEEERAAAEAAVTFSTDTLLSAHPYLNKAATIDDALSAASQRLDEGAFSEQPEMELRLRMVLLDIYSTLLQTDNKRHELEAALKVAGTEGSEELAMVLLETAWAQESRGEGEAAMLTMARAMEMEAGLSGRESCRYAIHQKIHAQLLSRREQYAESIDSYRQALAIQTRCLAEGDEDGAREVFGLKVNLAETLSKKGPADESISLLREAIALGVETWGGEHLRIAHARVRLGRVQQNMGQPEDGIATLNEAISAFDSQLGAGHAYSAQALHYRAQIHASRGDTAAALADAAAAVAAYEGSFSDGERFQIELRRHYTGLLLESGQPEAADAFTAELVERLADREPWRVALAGALVAESLARQGRCEEARPLLESAREVEGSGVLDSVLADLDGLCAG